MRQRLPPEEMFPAGDPAYSVRYVDAPSGVRLRVVERGPADGEPVLLIHGWAASLFSFRLLFEALARSNRRAIALDLRGHGLSDKPLGGSRYTRDAMVGDVAAVLDAVGVESADVVGHSMGGSIALFLALDVVTRVRRLVLIAPTGLSHVRIRDVAAALTPRVMNLVARYITPRWLIAMVLRWTYAVPRRLTEYQIDQYWAPSRSPDWVRALRALLHHFDWQPVSQARLHTLLRRTLVILGKSDRLIVGVPDGARSLPHATIVSIPSSGHLCLEECAHEVTDELLRFLETTASVA